MVRIIFLFCLILAQPLLAQQEIYIQPGLLKSSATIGAGDVLSNPDKTFYITGFAEYFSSEKVSLRGDTYFMIPISDEQIVMGDEPLMRGGMRSFFGAFYHFAKGNLDYNVGFQPGLSILDVRNSTPLNESFYSRIASPGFNLQTGLTFYVWKYFHFYAQLSYVKSNLFGVDKFEHNADELIFSGGLGFQIQTTRKK